MSDTPVCRSTRTSAGCGHPTADHDGNPLRPCDCCARAMAIEAMAGGLNRAQRRAMGRHVRRSRS